MRNRVCSDDPASPTMAMDILNNVLSRADNPGSMGACLTEEVRDLTGAACAILIECRSAPHRIDHRIISVNPLRMFEWADSPARKEIYEAVHFLATAQILHGDEHSELARLLMKEGFRLSMVLPLRTGRFRVGAMMVLGLPDEERVSSVMSLLSDMSAIVALVLRNAVLYEEQEQIIGERTVELRDNNEKLAMELRERRRVEDELQKLNAELDLRVRERTAQLEAANRELEAFSYTIAHDLRAPLRHMNGFLGLLHRRLEQGLDDKSRHYMNVISESAISMGRLIDDFLAFSRMGRLEISGMKVDLTALVYEVIHEHEHDTDGRSVNWRISRLPVVTGDPVMLKLVLCNLISNALKFTKTRKQAEIEIGCLPSDEMEATVFIKDNGVGFEMEFSDKLFGVFQRLHRVEEFEGNGIGLANVRRIISRHGGRTWAEGRVDQGATVYFSLPL